MFVRRRFEVRMKILEEKNFAQDVFASPIIDT
jgi:hypothetical protein